MIVLRAFSHHLQHPGVAGLQIDRAVDVQPISPAGLRDRDRHPPFGAQQPTGRAACVGYTASANITASSAVSWFISSSERLMKAACLAGSNLREISLGLRCSIPSRCNSMIRPDRPWYSMPNSCADKGANLACGPGQYLADPGLHPLLLCVGQATSSTVVTEVRQAFDAPSWYSRYHVRIVSSSSSSTLATASQLIPSSSSTSALARRASRCGADPSRANSIRSCR